MVDGRNATAEFFPDKRRSTISSNSLGRSATAWRSATVLPPLFLSPGWD